MSSFKTSRKALVLALAAAGLALGAQAQANTGAASSAKSHDAAMSGGKSTSASLSAADRKFIEKAAAGGMAEVHMGQLAADKAQSPEVKQFGERMVKDHGKANEELKELASSKGVEIPADTDRKHQAKMDQLSKKSGAAFDRDYMKDMVADHKDDVGEFRKMAKDARDPDVKAFAARTLPTLEEHQKLAKAANEAVGKGGTKTSAAHSTDTHASSGSSTSTNATSASAANPAATGATNRPSSTAGSMSGTPTTAGSMGGSGK